MLKNRVFLFFIGLLVSVLLLEGGVRAASPLLGPPLVSWNTMEDAKRLKLDEFRQKYGQPNFVFMGNSTTLIGVDTNVIDDYTQDGPLRSFNAGMNGANIVNMRDFAINFIIPEVKPKNLVLLFSNVGMLLNSNYEKVVVRKNVLLESFQLYNYRNTLRDPMTLNTFIRILKFRDYKQGIIHRWAAQLNDFGFQDVTRSSIYDKGWDVNVLKEGSNRKIVIDIDQLRYISEIRDSADSQGIKLIIGTVPTLAFDQKFRETIREVASILNIEFIQGNNAVSSGQYFQDGTHLNYQGRVEFSEFVGSEIKRMKLRGDTK